MGWGGNAELRVREGLSGERPERRSAEQPGCLSSIRHTGGHLPVTLRSRGGPTTAVGDPASSPTHRQVS